MKPFPFLKAAQTNSKCSLSIKWLGTLFCAFVVLAIIFPCFGIAETQQEPNSLKSRQTDPEIRKLELKSTKPTGDRGEPTKWVFGFLGFLVGLFGAAASVWVARKARRGALDQAVHEKRLASYPRLVKASAPLAIYFPRKDDSPVVSIGPQDCRAVGKAMSKWYFEDGGLLLSTEARDVYFRLARALTRASCANELNVPVFPDDAQDISDKKVKKYRKELGLKPILDDDDVENWTFGDCGSENKTPVYRFKDYIFLQRLSSTLRTKLSEDIKSRRRPS